MFEAIMHEAQTAVSELIQAAKLKQGEILVVGCSSSEVIGQRIGSASSFETAQALFTAIHPLLRSHKIYLAAQCCEHLNRAVIIEREAARQYLLEEVNVVPQPKAGGSFATAAYQGMRDPVAVETVRAHAGIDIGGTLIGMHLRRVAVPVRLSMDHIGEAILLCARTRPPFVGGARAHYNEDLL